LSTPSNLLVSGIEISISHLSFWTRDTLLISLCVFAVCLEVSAISLNSSNPAVVLYDAGDLSLLQPSSDTMIETTRCVIER
jgi:hypothetical protein